MASVLHKTTSPPDYRQSVHTPDFPDGSWFINPDISAVVSVPTKYWVLADPVTEMDAGQKAAVDAAEAAALTAANRTEAIDPTTDVTGPGVHTRAMIELHNKRINFAINRIVELQQALDVVRDSPGNGNARLDTLPATWLATSTRTKADAITDYTDDINAGNQDT